MTSFLRKIIIALPTLLIPLSSFAYIPVGNDVSLESLYQMRKLGALKLVVGDEIDTYLTYITSQGFFRSHWFSEQVFMSAIGDDRRLDWLKFDRATKCEIGAYPLIEANDSRRYIPAGATLHVFSISIYRHSVNLRVELPGSAHKAPVTYTISCNKPLERKPEIDGQNRFTEKANWKFASYDQITLGDIRDSFDWRIDFAFSEIKNDVWTLVEKSFK